MPKGAPLIRRDCIQPKSFWRLKFVKNGGLDVSDREGQISDGGLSLTNFRRQGATGRWFEQGLKTQLSAAAPSRLRFFRVSPGRRIRSFFIR